MAIKNVSIKVDEELLKRFDEFASDIGANRSVVLNMLMTACVKSQKFPEISAQQNAYDFGKEM